MLLIGKNKFYQSKCIKGELSFEKYSSVQKEMKKKLTQEEKFMGCNSNENICL